MKISTKGRYGLRAMVDIASHFEKDKPVSIKSISERQGISEGYLEQLVAPLRKSGLIKSIRGAQGGYILKVPAIEISVGDILRIMEGDLTLVNCEESNFNDDCDIDYCKTCVTRKVWNKLDTTINEVVDNIMLNELVDDYKTLSDLEPV